MSGNFQEKDEKQEDEDETKRTGVIMIGHLKGLCSTE